MYLAVADYKSYFRLIMGIAAGMAICFAIYLIFPTTVPRPEVTGNDIFSRLVRFVYSRDNPYNCFPSIHVLDTVLATLFMWKSSRSGILKGIALPSCILICVSTLFVKQHYILDGIAATILAMSLYMVFTNEYLFRRVTVRKIINFLIPPAVKSN